MGTDMTAEVMLMHKDLWGIPRDDHRGTQAVLGYLGFMRERSYFTQGVCFNRVMTGESFLFVAVSNARSTRLFVENMACMQQGQPILRCYWCEYDVFLFRNLILGNISGMCDSMHQGSMLTYPLAEVLLTMATEHGVAQPQQLLGMPVGAGSMIGCLGMALTASGVNVWHVVETGLSLEHMYGIDMYIKHLSPRLVDFDGYTAWWIGNVATPWHSRYARGAEDWWVRVC